MSVYTPILDDGINVMGSAPEPEPEPTPDPTLVSVSPTTADLGDTLTLTGTDLGGTTGAFVVNVDGEPDPDIPLDVGSVSDTEVVVTVPADGLSYGQYTIGLVPDAGTLTLVLAEG